MPDLSDGESAEFKGSARLPYVLRNVGGVYSCSCPAWRNQSIGIERRTCKHLRKFRGAEAEDERIGSTLSARAESAADPSSDEPTAGPGLLLAQSWTNDVDLTGWWISEKLDGVRAYWDGQRFISRQGNLFHAPDWFVEQLPSTPLDGELWLARKSFQRTVSIVRRQDKSDHWRELTFRIFDAPSLDQPFEQRLQYLCELCSRLQLSYAAVMPQVPCRGIDHLREEMDRVEGLGGEGLMLREPRSRYEAGRSSTLLKVKRFHDAEAQVVEHLPGAGRHQGRLGALGVTLPDGTRFSVGTGFSDAQRAAPPAIGSTITFRYQELTDRGVPRFPSFLRVRTDAALATGPPAVATISGTPTVAAQPETRRFEFSGGGSDKFWEVRQHGSDVTVRYGRLGTQGQSQTKSLPDAAAAQRHVEKLVAEKTGKGYLETHTNGS